MLKVIHDRNEAERSPQGQPERLEARVYSQVLDEAQKLKA
jgi:hypothetical protein